jgi:hypothetical protein
MAGAPKPDQELKRICGAIATARQNLNDESGFDVSPLTASLDGLCEQIAAMPVDMAKTYAAPLQATLKLLEALEEDIRGAHGALQQRMRAMAGAKAAGGDGEESVD